MPSNANMRHDVHRLTSMTLAGVEAKKTRQVKLCCVSLMFCAMSCI